MVVGCTGFASKVGVFQYRMDVAPQGCRGSARLSQASSQKPLHEECGTVWNGLLLFRFCRIDDVAVAVENFSNQDGRIHLAVVYDRAVAVDQFQQIDIGGA